MKCSSDSYARKSQRKNMRKFNVTGLCTPEEDYMVDISGKIEQIRQLVDDRCYFTINRARQYGKTTTLNELKKRLNGEYICIKISFERFGDKNFDSSEAFCKVFIKHIVRALRFSSATGEYADQWARDDITDFDLLGDHITDMCEGHKVVLIIDEVDKTSNNLVFLHFLGMLRAKFLARKEGMDSTFHSVILAEVVDIRNIRLKMAQEGLYTPALADDKIYNSPWNIAANFLVDLSFNPTEISTMLNEYEADHHTGMDIPSIADEIYSYTSGYPFLVSRICQCIDGEQGNGWTAAGVQNAVKTIMEESNPLFDDVFKNLLNNRQLSEFTYNLLIVGELTPFMNYDPIINIGVRYGFFCNTEGKVAISNKIFERLMTDYFMSKDRRENKQVTGVLQFDVVQNGRFDMELCLRKFAEHYSEIFSGSDTEFLEVHGRLLFLSYLKPLINGQGFYHIESQFTDLRRMDIVVDFGRQQFIIKLKIWRGAKAEEKATQQLLGYMETKRADTGYLLIFDFRKVKGKACTAKWVECDGKRIFEVVI